MSTTDDLVRLAELHRQGQLSDTEYAQAKARVLQAGPRGEAGGLVPALNGLRRSLSDRWVGGVCGGLAQATGLAVWMWRLGFALLTFFGGTGLLIYALLWVFLPSEPPALMEPRRLGA